MDVALVPSTVKKSPLVTQSNKITEARYSLTVAEQRLVLTLISMISPEDENFKDYEIKIADFQRLLDIKDKDFYKRTEETIVKLASRVIHIKKEKGYLVSHWFSSAEYMEDEGKVFISFDKKLKPYFLQLREQFTKYNLFTVANFKSAYTIRIYMLLKQYQNIGFREFELQELREILGIDKKEYLVFKDFKKRVINQAKKEFEQKKKDTGGFQSDITFDLETKRTGRKISHLKFIIKKQNYQETLPLILPEPEERTRTTAIKTLEKYGIGYDIAHRYEQEQGEEAIFKCVAVYEQKKNAGEIQTAGAGYLLKLLENRAGQKTEAEQEEEEKAKAKKEAKAEDIRKKQEAEKLKTLRDTAQRIVKYKFIKNLSESEKRKYVAQINEQFITPSLQGKNPDDVLLKRYIISFIETLEDDISFLIKNHSLEELEALESVVKPKEEKQKKKQRVKTISPEEADKKVKNDFITSLSEDEKKEKLEEAKTANPELAHLITDFTEKGVGFAVLRNIIPDFENQVKSLIKGE